MLLYLGTNTRNNTLFKAGVHPKVVFWLGIMVLWYYGYYGFYLYASITYLRFWPFCNFFGDSVLGIVGDKFVFLKG